MENILLIGNDRRLDYLKKMLDEAGFLTAHISGSHTAADFSLQSAAARAGAIIGPTPFSRLTELTEPEVLLSSMHRGQKLFGGNIPPDFQRQAEAAGVIVLDFMKMEEVTLKNAIATAEGTVCEAISLSPLNIRGSRCLLLGFGRCGSTLGETLLGLKARVTAWDRDEERLARARKLGCACLPPDSLEAERTAAAKPPVPLLSPFDFIFNTIPAPVLTVPLLEGAKPDAVIIDIASAPGGTDFGACGRLGIPAKLCPGLPGRYSPASSAKILYQAVISRL